MPKHLVEPSRPSREALAVLGGQIKAARIKQRWSQADLADRVGVDARTVAAIEKGASTVGIGTVFNAAFITGVNLFGLEGNELALARRRGQETLALLPKRIRSNTVQEPADDDF